MKHHSIRCYFGFIVTLLFSLKTVSARPNDFNEQSRNKYLQYLDGVYVGFETLLALMGYYETDEVKTGVSNEKVIINPASIESQTEIKVVGLGLGRTGTTSLALALEILGYKVVHDDEQTELTDLYAAEERGMISEDEMNEILGWRGYNATFKTADQHWVAEHPEVKAILTVRDNADKFVDSWLAAAPFIRTIEQRPFCWMDTVQELMPSFQREFRMETTGGKPENYLDRETLRENYEQYIKRVQKAIPKNRLLVFNVKEGWEPLCKYLGKPIPEDIPFPHVHTRIKLQGEMNFLHMITWVWPLAIIVPLLIVKMITEQITSIHSSSNCNKKI